MAPYDTTHDPGLDDTNTCQCGALTKNFSGECSSCFFQKLGKTYVPIKEETQCQCGSLTIAADGECISCFFQRVNTMKIMEEEEVLVFTEPQDFEY